VSFERTAFLSYARADNELDEGRVLELARRIKQRYEMLSAQSLDLFVDEEDLEWGSEWRTDIDQALETASFLIAIITPTYFLRRECRREFILFKTRARQFGQAKLLLPILWVEVPDFSEDSFDRAIAIAASTEYIDCRGIGDRTATDRDYIRIVHQLARRLYEASSQMLLSTAGWEPPSSAEFQQELTDLVSAGVGAFRRWESASQELGRVVAEVGDNMARASERLEWAEGSDRPLHARFRVVNSLAHDLSDIADRAVELGSQYIDELMALDAPVRFLIHLAEEPDVGEEDRPNVESFLGTIEHMVMASRGNREGLTAILRTLDSTVEARPQLGSSLGKFRAGAQGVLDGGFILEDWGRLLRHGRSS
jgi:hypothetical protein